MAEFCKFITLFPMICRYAYFKKPTLSYHNARSHLTDDSDPAYRRLPDCGGRHDVVACARRRPICRIRRALHILPLDHLCACCPRRSLPGFLPRYTGHGHSAVQGQPIQARRIYKTPRSLSSGCTLRLNSCSVCFSHIRIRINRVPAC